MIVNMIVNGSCLGQSVVWLIGVIIYPGAPVWLIARLVQLHVALSHAYPCNTLQGGVLGHWATGVVHNP